jgi:hypothetical protein
VAFSPPHGPLRNSPYDDYTAGDTHDLHNVTCDSRFVSGAQWHVVTYLGYTWGGYALSGHQPAAATKVAHAGPPSVYMQKGPVPRYDPNQAADLTAHCLRGGGVVTWDVRLTRQGRIADDFLPALKAIGKSAAQTTR